MTEQRSGGGFDGDPMRQIARGSFLSGIGALVASVGGVLLTLVVARSFSQALAGTFFAGTAFFLILSSLATLGTDVGLVRYVSAHSATGQQHRLLETLRIALVPVLGVSTACGIGMWFFAPTLADWIGKEGVIGDTTDILRALAPFVPVASVYTALLAATRGRGSMKYTVVVDSVFRTVGQPAFFLVTVWAGWSPAVSAVGWALPYLVGAGYCALVLARQAKRMSQRSAREVVADIALADQPADLTSDTLDAGTGVEPAADEPVEVGLRRDFWNFTAARAVAGAVVMIWRRFDVLLVAALSGPADAAVYTAATRFLVVGSLGIQAVQMTVSPQLGRLFAQNDLPGARRVYATATMWTMTFAWPLYLVAAAAVGLVIPIFGAGYDAGASAVIVLSGSMLVATACGSVDAVLLMSGRSMLSLANAVVTLVVNVGLDLWLIPKHGILGAAIGWAFSIALRNVLALIQINRLMEMWAFTRQSAKIAGVSVLCFAVAPGILTVTDAGNGWLVLSLVLGTVAYVAWAWVERRPLQLNTFGNSLRRRTRPA